MMFVTLLLILCVIQTIPAKDLPKDDKPGEIVIRATNRTSVPSVHYIIDAVDCLKQAYTVYSESLDQVQVYAELFQERHNETGWNVVAGYTAVYIKSQWYIETSVSNSYQKKKGDTNKDTLYLIFSTA